MVKCCIHMVNNIFLFCNIVVSIFALFKQLQVETARNGNGVGGGAEINQIVRAGKTPVDSIISLQPYFNSNMPTMHLI